MNNTFLVAAVIGGVLAAGPRPGIAANWGQPVTNWASVTNACVYDVYRQNFRYDAQSFLITDTRSDIPPVQIYSDKTNYEIRSADIYRAGTGTNLFTDQPVVFFVHGGAWTDGYRGWYDFLAQSFTGNKGWVTVIVDYRLTSSNVFLAGTSTKSAWYPDNMDDAAQALQWTLSNISTNGGDPERVVLFGHSAGGHMVSLLVTHPDYAPSFASTVKGVISMSGLYSLTNQQWLALLSNDVNQTFHGGMTNTAALTEASSATYVNTLTNLPSIYILNGTTIQDLPGFWEQGVVFYNRLELLGFDVTNSILTDYTHTDEIAVMGNTNELPTSLILDYIEDTLALADIAAPTGLAASQDPTPWVMNLSWTASPGAVCYEVWRGTINDTAEALCLADAVFSVAYQDASIAPDVVYYYWIKAANTSGTSPFSDGASGMWHDAWPITNCDYDGDGISDLTVYHESSGYWYIMLSGSDYSLSSTQFGALGYVPASSDFDGDGKSDVAVYCASGAWPGYWYILNSTDYSLSYMQFGASGYASVPNDYDGDGKADLAVYCESGNMPGYWFIFNSSDYSVSYMQFGDASCTPIPSDYDGDGKSDMAVYQEASGYWYIFKSSDYSLAYQQFGAAGYEPVPGDYDGDGIADMVVYHEDSGYWYFLLSSSGYAMTYQQFGGPGYVPVGR